MDYQQKLLDLKNRSNTLRNDIQKDIKRNEHYISVLNNTSSILDDLDEKFKLQTGLTDTDISLMFVAIGLQIARQYLFSNEKYRISSNQGDMLAKNMLSPLPRTASEILTQSVPYDAIATGAHISDTGLSGTTHRFRTLGHDPILGWIFGTANIITNSLTKNDFVTTYQISNNKIIRHYPLGTMHMLNNSIEYSKRDPIILPTALARQAIHFGSDYFTKQGLPIPIISTVNESLAKEMISKWHIDMYSVTRSAGLSIFINNIISLIHQLFYNGNNTDLDYKLYEVRTKKIILYSNLIASSSNVAVVALTKDLSKLDIGGIGVCIYQYITSKEFIRAVKEEFIFGQYKEIFLTEKNI